MWVCFSPSSFPFHKVYPLRNTCRLFDSLCCLSVPFHKCLCTKMNVMTNILVCGQKPNHLSILRVLILLIQPEACFLTIATALLRFATREALNQSTPPHTGKNGGSTSPTTAFLSPLLLPAKAESPHPSCAQLGICVLLLTCLPCHEA